MKITPLLDKYFRSGSTLGIALLLLSNTCLAGESTQNSATYTASATLANSGSTTENEIVRETEQRQSEFYKNFIKGKFSLGTRIVHRNLTDDDSGAKGGTHGSGTFVGTIYALEEEQSYAPTKIFMSYFFTKYFGMELAWDSMEASTRATSVYSSGSKSDGNVSLYGPTLSILTRIPNSSQFTPYGGFGFGFFAADFDETADWGLGYLSPSHYESLGSPSTPFKGYTREMKVDNTVAIILTAGVTWDFAENWFLDFSGQYLKADTDADFYSYSYGEGGYTGQSGNFPMDNFAVRLGVGYTF